MTTYSTAKPVKPAISWPGGKARLVRHILPLVQDHTCYCEPFAGGLAVLLAKTRSQLEVLNDINGDLVNFYRCVRFHADVLLTELEFVLNSRQEFNDFRQQHGLTDIQRAARWYYRNKNGFGGVSLDSFGRSASSGGASHGSRAARMESIRALNHRLDRVCIEQLSWERCLELYDRAETLFFCDPPYTDCDAGAYATWTETDVRRLREALDACKARWIVTLNDNASNRAIFDGCVIKSIDRQKGINGGGKRYREIIITPS